MRLPDFKVEQWMNDYENDAIYNMTDTCVKDDGYVCKSVNFTGTIRL